jgi:hypothetical protein
MRWMMRWIRYRVKGDRGASKNELSLAALVVGLLVLFLAFKAISAGVGTEMNNPGGGGSPSTTCDLPVRSECP